MNALEHLVEVCKGHKDRSREIIAHSALLWGVSIADYIELENGATHSVQASATAYSTPRDNTGPYSAVEVGYPRGVRIPETWKEYADGESLQKSTIFGYVPVELVRDLILANCPKLRAELDAKLME